VKGDKFFIILGKLGYIFVVIGFCMPIACDQNGFPLSNFLIENEKALFGLLIIVMLILAIAGIVIGILLLASKKVNTVIDWITAVACIVSGLIVYFGCLADDGIKLQSGAYVILLGWIIALAGQIVSVVPNIGITALKTLAYVSALSGMVVLAGCGGNGGGGGNTPGALVGKWVETDGSEEMEFLSNGTAIFKEKGLSMGGTWNIVDKRLVMTASVLGMDVSKACDYKLSGYELTVVEDGDTTTYVRKEKLEDYKAKQAKTKTD
jgi:hypothetical protein